MDVNELRATIARLKGRIEAETAKAHNKGDEIFGELLSDGLGVIGEALIDLKRIADAAENGGVGRLVDRRYD